MVAKRPDTSVPAGLVELADQAEWFPDMLREFLFYRAYDYDAAALLEMQARRLDKLLTRALAQVPAVRQLGIDRAGTDDPFALLARFPLLRKPQMRDNFLDHCADDIDPAGCLTCTTSGSTGIPLKVIHDREHLVHSHALALRRYLDYGLPFDRKVLRPFHQHADTWREHTRLGAGVVRLGDFGFLDAFGKAQRCEIARRCVEFRPDVSFTHPSRMIDLVRLFHEFGQWMSLTAIAGTGEVASNAVRQELSTFFEAPFYALYGLSELSTVASECEFGSLHIESERLWVEIVDDAGTVLPDGAEGEIVVTNLFNSSAPFIRYRTGDLGALGTLPCPCGRPQKVLRLLVGRQLAQIVLPGGERWDALRVVRVVDTFPVKRLQVIQESRRDLVVLVDPLPQFTRQTLVAVHDAVHTALDGQLMVRVEVVTDTQFHHRNQVKNVNFIPLGAT